MNSIVLFNRTDFPLSFLQEELPLGAQVTGKIGVECSPVGNIVIAVSFLMFQRLRG